VYSEAGTPTGRIVARGTRLRQGEYYLVVHVWIKNETGRYLVQKRAPNRESEPGIWATTAGYVQAGEESVAGAIREAGEELGITLSSTQLRHFARLKTGNRVEDIWLAEVTNYAVGVPTIGPEVSDYKWVSKAELDSLANRGEFFAYSYLGILPG